MIFISSLRLGKLFYGFQKGKFRLFHCKINELKPLDHKILLDKSWKFSWSSYRVGIYVDLQKRHSNQYDLMNIFRVWFNDSWFVFQNSSWSFREPYFSIEHLFHESYKVNRTQESPREKCLSVFWVILVRIFPYSNWIWRNTPYLPVSPYPVRIGENATQNNSEYKRFLRSD